MRPDATGGHTTPLVVRAKPIVVQPPPARQARFLPTRARPRRGIRSRPHSPRRRPAPSRGWRARSGKRRLQAGAPRGARPVPQGAGRYFEGSEARAGEAAPGEDPGSPTWSRPSPASPNLAASQQGSRGPRGGAARASRLRPPLRSPSKYRPPAPQIAPLRALPRAPRGAHGSGRRWGAHSRFSRRAKRKPGGFPPGFVLVVELAPIRPCGASGAVRGRRGPARRSKARGRQRPWSTSFRQEYSMPL